MSVELWGLGADICENSPLMLHPTAMAMLLVVTEAGNTYRVTQRRLWIPEYDMEVELEDW